MMVLWIDDKLAYGRASAVVAATRGIAQSRGLRWVAQLLSFRLLVYFH